jgi:hypothetical protein
MIYKGRTWYRSRTVVTLPEMKDGKYIQFGKICDKDTPGAVETTWTRDGSNEKLWAKPIPDNGYSLTNMMYGKHFVRDDQVRVKAYLCLGAGVYTTSWVHWNETAKRHAEGKSIESRLIGDFKGPF